jgi:hypothetical protein
MVEIDLEGSDLQRAKFIHADLTRARLKGADIRHADLSESICIDADFPEAQLNFTTFKNNSYWRRLFYPHRPQESEVSGGISRRRTLLLRSQDER